MPKISAVGILRQEDCQFETNLGYIQKKPVKNKKQKQKTPPQKQGRKQRTPKAVPICTTNQTNTKTANRLYQSLTNQDLSGARSLYTLLYSFLKCYLL